jgi:hypothetical protein
MFLRLLDVWNAAVIYTKGVSTVFSFSLQTLLHKRQKEIDGQEVLRMTDAHILTGGYLHLRPA